MALVRWDKLCEMKECGRLGFKRFEDINSALLAKLTWDVASRAPLL